MTIQEANKLAIKQGFSKGWNESSDRPNEGGWDLYSLEMRAALLDPDWWQALGKGLGWESKLCPTCGTEYGLRGRSVSWCENYCEDVGFPTTPMFPWQYHWHRLIDHLAEGKSIEDFFANLIKE